MHKKILVLLTGAIALSISAIPVLASDPPTDDGQYIWQDENGDLFVKPVPSVLEAVSEEEIISMKPLTGEWKLAENSASVNVK